MKKNLTVVTACAAILTLCAPDVSARDNKKKSPSAPTAGVSPTPSASNQTTAKQKTAKTDPAQPKVRDLKSSNVDVEVARVKKQLREIQTLPITREEKIQKQRALLDGEAGQAKEQMREIQSDSKGTNRDRRKAGLDNIQKFLDIVRSMNPQI